MKGQEDAIRGVRLLTLYLQNIHQQGLPTCLAGTACPLPATSLRQRILWLPSQLYYWRYPADFNAFYVAALQLLNQFNPERLISVTSRDPNYITPAIKSKFRRKNRLSRAGRTEEGNALARRIGKDIAARNRTRLSRINHKKCATESCRRWSDSWLDADTKTRSVMVSRQRRLTNIMLEFPQTLPTSDNHASSLLPIER